MARCRLCSGPVRDAFQGRVLGKYDVRYERCDSCGSLQTEPPHWLEEAYRSHNLAVEDTGAVTRSLTCQAVIWVSARILHLPKRASVFDFGGGNGLLCRLLRDRGFDAHLEDNYATNDFARGFEDNRSTYDISCAFEVAEHLADPKVEMPKILNRSQALCVVGTETYFGQGADWWYLAREAGQHVFFYTEASMLKLAAAEGRDYLRIGSFHLFLARAFTKFERAALMHIIAGRGLKLVQAYLSYTLSYARAIEDAAALAKVRNG